MAQSNTRSTTVKRSLKILEELRENDGLTVTEVSDNLDIAKSTASRYLMTLYDQEYLIKEDGTYYLSLQFLKYGSYLRHRKDGYEKIEAKVEELAEQTGERVQFIVEEHGRGIYLYRQLGEHAVVQDMDVGMTRPIHTTAAGKSIIAHTPRSYVEKILDIREMEPLTKSTVVERDQLFEELEQIRERGYSLNDQETIKGHRAVGVPIFTQDETVLGGLSISAPKNRMNDDRFRNKLPEMLTAVANEIELSIKYS